MQTAGDHWPTVLRTLVVSGGMSIDVTTSSWCERKQGVLRSLSDGSGPGESQTFIKLESSGKV